jgi:hypothetical protein
VTRLGFRGRLRVARLDFGQAQAAILEGSWTAATKTTSGCRRSATAWKGLTPAAKRGSQEVASIEEASVLKRFRSLRARS